MKRMSTLVLMAMAMAGGPALAQTLKSVKVEPAATSPGQAVTVTAQLELTENPNCGLHVHFGDGVSSTFKINQAKDATIVVKHSYAKAGSYTVMVEPKRVGSVLKCTGDNQKAVVTVGAAQVSAGAPAATQAPAGATAAVAAAPAAAAAVATSCPDGWKLAAKSVSKKTGAFECTAKGGTAAPAKRLECPGSLTYFENTKTGRLGCRP